MTNDRNRRSGRGSRRRTVATIVLGGLFALPAFHTGFVRAQDERADEATPLSRKQKMIQDRFERFQDQLFRLREELSEVEPENAARLGRALERSGEFGLQDKLAELVEILNDSSLLTGASDAQRAWLEEADKILNILLERDSGNEQRKDEIDRLNEYRRSVGELLKEQQALRDASAQAALAQRMLQQLEQAIQRVEAARKKQGDLAQKSQGQARAPTQHADEQVDLSRETKQLAEDVQRLSEMKAGDDSTDTPGMESARGKAQDAAQSIQQSADAMSQAGEALKQSDAAESGTQQKQADSALQDAKEKLEEARDALQAEEDAKQQAAKQGDLAQKTGDLSQKMQQDAAGEQEGQQGQQGQSGESKPGQKSLDKAKNAMDKATESLEKERPDQATPEQDRALDQLQQAQKELEEELEELRKEEREEMLRDLEARFREMLIKQRGINDSTLSLDAIGQDNFKRSERLQVADLAADQQKLSQAAATCLHILEEDATTVVFPRVLGQLSEDMALVAKRLADLKVGRLTQSIEQEIVETLEQLLEAVQRMQQENEQGGKPGKGGDSGQDKPLLPESAELKLLRASQMRVNTRTDAITEAIAEGTESERTSAEGLKTVAGRQRECAEIAREMRDKKQTP